MECGYNIHTSAGAVVISDGCGTDAADNDVYLFDSQGDHVFDGSRSNYTENDTTNPVNTYGLTKLAGEIAAASLFLLPMICR